MQAKYVIYFLFILMIALVYWYSPITNSPPSNRSTPNPTIVSHDDWKTHTIRELGLTFRAPPEMKVHGEVTDEVGTYTLYVERGSYPAPTYYQLYGILQPETDEPYTELELDAFKDHLEPGTAREFLVDGYKAVEGQLKGERNRFATRILRQHDLFELYTSQPTAENKELTDQILATFDFE